MATCVANPSASAPSRSTFAQRPTLTGSTSNNHSFQHGPGRSQPAGKSVEAVQDPFLLPSAWVEAQLNHAITPDPKQVEILDAPAHRLALLCARQWGKSTVLALKSLHHAIHNPKSHILISSAAQRQSGLLLDKVLQFIHHLGLSHIRRRDFIALPNGSIFRSLPGSPDTIRGFSAVNIMIIDEAAFATDDLFHAAMPFLATTNGAMWLASTPNGQTGFFYDIITSSGNAPHDNFLEPSPLRGSGHAASPSDASAHERRASMGRVDHVDPGPHEKSAHGTPDRVSHANPDQRNAGTPLRSYPSTPFLTFTITATDNPRISPEFLADERAIKSAAQFAQEYLCQFLPTNGQIFDAAILASSSVTANDGTLAPTLLFGLDIGFQQSHTAIAALQLTWSYTGRDPISQRDQYLPHLKLLQLHRFPLATAHSQTWETIHQLITLHTDSITKLGQTKPTRVLLFDYAGAGQTYHEHFKRNCKDIQVQPITITSALTPGASGEALTIPRQDLLNNLKVLLETRQLTIPGHLNHAKELIDELKGLKITNTQSTPDDLAIALSLAAYRARIQMANPPSGLAKGRIV